MSRPIEQGQRWQHLQVNHFLLLSWNQRLCHGFGRESMELHMKHACCCTLWILRRWEWGTWAINLRGCQSRHGSSPLLQLLVSAERHLPAAGSPFWTDPRKSCSWEVSILCASLLAICSPQLPLIKFPFSHSEGGWAERQREFYKTEMRSSHKLHQPAIYSEIYWIHCEVDLESIELFWHRTFDCAPLLSIWCNI